MTRGTAEKVKTVTLHERAVETLLAGDPRMKRTGFWKDARALWNELVIEYEEYDEGFPKAHWLPDAFLIDRDNKRLVLFEVVDHHPLSRRKSDEMGDFWFQWDEMSFPWDIWLFIVNRFGHPTHRLDMADLFVESVLQAAHDKRSASICSNQQRETGREQR